MYSDPKRDPRRHILTVVFIGIILKGVPNPKDDSSAIQWIQLDDIQKKDLALIINRYFLTTFNGERQENLLVI